jgi:hypothetical protein
MPTRLTNNSQERQKRQQKKTWSDEAPHDFKTREKESPKSVAELFVGAPLQHKRFEIVNSKHDQDTTKVSGLGMQQEGRVTEKGSDASEDEEEQDNETRRIAKWLHSIGPGLREYASDLSACGLADTDQLLASPEKELRKVLNAIEIEEEKQVEIMRAWADLRKARESAGVSVLAPPVSTVQSNVAQCYLFLVTIAITACIMDLKAMARSLEQGTGWVWLCLCSPCLLGASTAIGYCATPLMGVRPMQKPKQQ